MNTKSSYAAMTAAVSAVGAALNASSAHGGLLLSLMLLVTCGVSLGVLLDSMRRRAR